MKKALSLFLAVLMIFGALSVGAGATDGLYYGNGTDGKPATTEQCVVEYYLNGGTLKYSAYVFDFSTGKVSLVAGEDITGTYVQFPINSAGNIDQSIQKPGQYVVTPEVVAPANTTFMGWTITYVDTRGVAVSTSCAGGESWLIPTDAQPGSTIKMTAKNVATEAEEDTMAKVMSILIKIFGAIIGILMYQGDTEAGVALMEKVLGGVL